MRQRLLIISMPFCFTLLLAGCNPNPSNLRNITPRDLGPAEGGSTVAPSSTELSDVPILPELIQQPDITVPQPETAESTQRTPDPAAETPLKTQAIPGEMPSTTTPEGTSPSPSVNVITDKNANPYAEKLPGGMQLRVKERTFAPEASVSALRVSFDDLDLLRILNLDPVPLDAGEHLPDWLLALDGKSVVIRGYMYPPLTETGIQYFQLARDNDICCFGRNPKVYDRIGIALKPDKLTSHIQGRPFDVVGIFHIEAIDDGVELLQLYNMSEATIVDR